MAYDASRWEVVLFGGTSFESNGGPGVTLTDTWTFQGRSWTKHEPLTHPDPMGADLMVYEELTLTTVLVGRPEAARGQGSAQTWSWDGTTWSRLADVPLADTEVIQGFASDRADGQSVLLTWLAPAGPAVAVETHTWTWNGRSWSLRHPPQGLPVGASAPRVATLGSDAQPRLGRGVLAVMGGAGGGTQTWLWDGSTWSELAAGAAPAYDPLGGTMAVDDLTGFVVLIDSGGGATWLWDGSTWRQGAPAPNVDSLYGGTTLLDDTNVEHVIVIGDSGRPNRFDVLWMFDDLGWSSDRSA